MRIKSFFWILSILFVLPATFAYSYQSITCSKIPHRGNVHYECCADSTGLWGPLWVTAINKCEKYHSKNGYPWQTRNNCTYWTAVYYSYPDRSIKSECDAYKGVLVDPS